VLPDKEGRHQLVRAWPYITLTLSETSTAPPSSDAVRAHDARLVTNFNSVCQTSRVSITGDTTIHAAQPATRQRLFEVEVFQPITGGKVAKMSGTGVKGLTEAMKALGLPSQSCRTLPVCLPLTYSLTFYRSSY
jgi:hypothetical protein